MPHWTQFHKADFTTKKGRFITAPLKKELPNGTIQLAGNKNSQKYKKAIERKLRKARASTRKKPNIWLR